MIRKAIVAAWVLGHLGCHAVAGLSGVDEVSGGNGGGSIAVGGMDGSGGSGGSASIMCRPGAVRSCYTGPPNTVEVGLCTSGLQSCSSDGDEWGPCEGEVTPVGESCATPEDDDCDGLVNEEDAIDVGTDTHCGACGHDCQGGGCRSGLCQPVTLGSMGTSSRGIAVDSSGIYVTTYSSSNGQVLHFPLQGGDSTALVSSLNTPEGIALDNTHVYWVNWAQNGNGDVMRVLKTGGSPTTLASGTSMKRIAVDDTSVYWTNHHNGGSVMKVSKSGGPTTVLAANQGYPWGVAVDDTSVYWSTFFDHAIRRVPKNGGNVVTLSTIQGDAPTNLTIDNNRIYWTTYYTKRVYRIDKTGADLTLLAEGGSDGESIAVDSDDVYWPASFDVFRAPFNGSGKVSIADGTGHDCLAILGDTLYIARGSSVIRLAK